MSIVVHDFFSTPMLLSSSELMFEMSRSAPARATNTSMKIETTIANIVRSFLYDYYNHFDIQKIYPLTVLILKRISIMQGTYTRRTTLFFVPMIHTSFFMISCTSHQHVDDCICARQKIHCGKPVFHRGTFKYSDEVEIMYHNYSTFVLKINSTLLPNQNHINASCLHAVFISVANACQTTLISTMIRCLAIELQELPLFLVDKKHLWDKIHCATNQVKPKWRNWQTRYVQGVVRVPS